MPKTLFQAIGYRLGRKAAQARNAFELLSGTEEESLKAEIRLGRDMTSAMLERIPLVRENSVTHFAVEVLGWLAGHVKERTLPFTLWVTAETEPGPPRLWASPRRAFFTWAPSARPWICFVTSQIMRQPVAPMG